VNNVKFNQASETLFVRLNALKNIFFVIFLAIDISRRHGHVTGACNKGVHIPTMGTDENNQRLLQSLIAAVAWLAVVDATRNIVAEIDWLTTALTRYVCLQQDLFALYAGRIDVAGLVIR
jgi:hypothetical protein